jgi:hypothetical protein
MRLLTLKHHSRRMLRHLSFRVPPTGAQLLEISSIKPLMSSARRKIRQHAPAPAEFKIEDFRFQKSGRFRTQKVVFLAALKTSLFLWLTDFFCA